MKKTKLFGGLKLDFAGRNGDKDTMEAIFGKKPIPPTEMTKRLWTYIKRRQFIKVCT